MNGQDGLPRLALSGWQCEPIGLPLRIGGVPACKGIQMDFLVDSMPACSIQIGEDVPLKSLYLLDQFLPAGLPGGAGMRPYVVLDGQAHAYVVVALAGTCAWPHPRRSFPAKVV